MNNITYFSDVSELNPLDLIFVTKYQDSNVHGCVVVARSNEGKYKFHVSQEDVYEEMLDYFRAEGFRTYGEVLNGGVDFRREKRDGDVSTLVTSYAVCVDEDGYMTVVAKNGSAMEEQNIEHGNESIGI